MSFKILSNIQTTVMQKCKYSIFAICKYICYNAFHPKKKNHILTVTLSWEVKRALKTWPMKIQYCNSHPPARMQHCKTCLPAFDQWSSPVTPPCGTLCQYMKLINTFFLHMFSFVVCNYVFSLSISSFFFFYPSSFLFVSHKSNSMK